MVQNEAEVKRMSKKQNDSSIKIINKESCCGCGACESICPVNSIKLRLDQKGFYYPIIDIEKCIGCGKCVKVCCFQYPL